MNEIITVQNVRDYVDEQGTAWLNAADVARGLGWTQNQNGVEYVRLETLNGYLAEFGFDQKVDEKDFIPENIFYRLVWKSRDEKALAFQSKVAFCRRFARQEVIQSMLKFRPLWLTLSPMSEQPPKIFKNSSR